MVFWLVHCLLTSVDTASGTGIPGDESTMGNTDLSALGENFEHTPLVVLVRGHLDSIKRLLRGDVYIGRGLGSGQFLRAAAATRSKQSRSRVFAKHYALIQPSATHFGLPSGTRLVCDCRATEDCHGDVLIEEFRRLYPGAHYRNQPRGAPPGPEILSFLAKLREEPESDEGSSPDEGVPSKLAGHRG